MLNNPKPFEIKAFQAKKKEAYFLSKYASLFDGA
jgi:hypothetical protein